MFIEVHTVRALFVKNSIKLIEFTLSLLKPKAVEKPCINDFAGSIAVQNPSLPQGYVIAEHLTDNEKFIQISSNL